MVKKDIEAPVAQLVRASDRSSEDPGSNPGWISMSSFITCIYFITSDDMLKSVVERVCGFARAQEE